MRCLSVHLTDLCNSKCAFCVVGSPLFVRDEVDHEQVRGFLTTYAGHGYDVVNIHGGEPTIHPAFVSLLHYIVELGYHSVHLQTNGMRLEDNGFVCLLMKLGINLFIISLHGHHAEIQDLQTRSEGGFRKTCIGIANVKANGGLVRTNTVITQSNYRHLVDITALAVSLGVDHVNFSNLHPVGSAVYGMEHLVPRLADVESHLQTAVRLAADAGRKVTLEGFPYCFANNLSDLQLGAEYREVKMLYRGRVINDYDMFMDERMRRHGPPCGDCAARNKCGGVYPQYTALNGWDEFKAIALDEGVLPLLVCDS